MTHPQRGILYPARLPQFSRLPAAEELKDLVRWFWIPEWSLEAGRSSRQRLIAFPACNLVVESRSTGGLNTGVEGPTAADGLVEFSGPTTKTSFRDLSGKGWAVGALLKPAGAAFFAGRTQPPSKLAALQNSSLYLNEPKLWASVTNVMTGSGADGKKSSNYRENAVAAFQAFLMSNTGPPSGEALLANRLSELIENDKQVIKVEDAAAKLNISTRTVQRLAQRYVGLSASAMIRRRRLQEAAETIRLEPKTDLSALAAELGYFDHAHLSHDFQRILGISPSAYRRAL